MLQVKSQLTPLQVATALAGGTQGEHDAVPHELVDVFATQLAPQRWNPALHVKSQLAPSQVDVAFEGGTQGEHELPHVAVAAFEAQVAPQAW